MSPHRQGRCRVGLAPVTWCHGEFPSLHSQGLHIVTASIRAKPHGARIKRRVDLPEPSRLSRLDGRAGERERFSMRQLH